MKKNPKFNPKQAQKDKETRRRNERLKLILNPIAEEPQCRWNRFSKKDFDLVRLTDAVVEYGAHFARRLGIVKAGTFIPGDTTQWMPLSQYIKHIGEPHFGAATT